MVQININPFNGTCFQVEHGTLSWGRFCYSDGLKITIVEAEELVFHKQLCNGWVVS